MTMTERYTNPRFHKGARDTRGGSESAYREFSNALAKGNDKAYRTLGVRQHDAGATDSERRQDNARYNRGGRGQDNHMFPDQPAVTGKARGRTGPEVVSDRPINNLNRGVGKPASLGGPKLGSISKGAGPAEPGITGQPAAKGADKSLRGR